MKFVLGSTSSCIKYDDEAFHMPNMFHPEPGYGRFLE